nr:hypothetical protein [Zoogloeaceae bacterium]
MAIESGSVQAEFNPETVRRPGRRVGGDLRTPFVDGHRFVELLYYLQLNDLYVICSFAYGDRLRRGGDGCRHARLNGLILDGWRKGMEEVVVERPEDGVAVVRLNRPEARNALSQAVRQQLAAHFDALTHDAA